MQYDRKITISAGSNRRAMTWQAQTMLISELWARLQAPARGTETLAAYLNMKKAQQDDLKDVGGFMAGTLSGPRRKANNVTGRDVITLDLDNIPSGGTEDVLRRVEALGCGYCIYSTRKHSPAAPRLRVLLPTDRTMTADEYEPCARKMAEYIGLELMDPTTFEVSRLMYWPSCCADSQYIYVWKDKPLLSANGLLAKYDDWTDCTAWPQVPGALSLPKLAVKQGDPEGKTGVVGAFCRTYDIYRAMDELIPGIYEPVDNMPGRYTYLGGSTTGGAVIYDNGKFLYSHHATDPCSNRLVNAFDMVRLHRFGDKDDEAQPGTPTNRLPSYKAMCELAVEDKDVAALMSQERYQEAVQDFEGVTGTNDEDPANWMGKLAVNTQTGLPKSTIDNVWIILEHDPLLKGKFALNQFAGRGEVLGALPWDARTGRRFWDDNDNQGLYWYMERYHHITGNGKIDGALSLHSTAHAFNEIQDYLKGLVWDGTPRLDTLFVDYLGAADTPYTRAVTRKSFTAAVARAMVPGIKYDTMLILSGPQGLGKSTLLDKMSRGWFNDSIRTFEGKEASELLQGVWLVEVSELDAFRRTDVARIKQFLSLRADRFRAAYGRHVKELPRCCVFFGTTNTSDYLQDRTGNGAFGRWMWAWSRTQKRCGPICRRRLTSYGRRPWSAGGPESPFSSKGSWRTPPSKSRRSTGRPAPGRASSWTFWTSRSRRTGRAGRWTAAACSGAALCRVRSSWWTVTGCVPWRCGVRPWTASKRTSATPTRRKSTASLRPPAAGKRAKAPCVLATAEPREAF